MGRRHFGFGPAPRATMDSFNGVSCHIVNDDPRDSHPHGMKRQVYPPYPYNKHDTALSPYMVMDCSPSEPSPSRRVYHDRDLATTCGATEDLCTTNARRRQCSAPPPNQSRHTSRRLYPEHEQFESNSEDAYSATGSRRYLLGPDGYIAGPTPTVVRAGSTPSCRRHVENPAARPRSGSAARRGPMPLPAQRRHLQHRDHLVGGHVRRAEAPSSAHRVEGLRSSPTYSKTYDDTAVSMTFGKPQDVAASSPPARRPPRPEGPEDNLKGASLRGVCCPSPAPETANGGSRAASARPGRRPYPSREQNHGNLVGGGCEIQYSQGSPRTPMSRAPEDNLMGSLWRVGDYSPPTTPRTASVGRCSTPNDRSRHVFFNNIVA